MFGDNVKKYRKKNGWSQQKLAEKSGLAYNVITKLEQGIAKKPSIQTMMKLADAFEIPLDELVGRKSK